jgi:broad specificity phosphatase PhoE
MTLLYLIRHARSTWNTAGRMQGHADPPLDELGQQQARALAEFLQAETFHAVYASPLLRARATAEALARPRQLPVRLDDRLMERNLGEWTGLTGEEARERYPGHFGHAWRTHGPPGGENQAALTTRAAAALADILAAHPQEKVAVVSHGGTLSAYLAHVLGIPLEHPHVSFEFDNTAFARLLVTGERVRLLGLGENRP